MTAPRSNCVWFGKLGEGIFGAIGMSSSSATHFLSVDHFSFYRSGHMHNKLQPKKKEPLSATVVPWAPRSVGFMVIGRQDR